MYNGLSYKTKVTKHKLSRSNLVEVAAASGIKYSELSAMLNKSKRRGYAVYITIDKAL